MLRTTILSLAILGSLVLQRPAEAFCGFYVAKADAKLFNESSRVVLVRDGNRTVISMANDYQGDPKEFAIVVPVPTVLEREQIHVSTPKIIDHLDAYTAPRLVEYHDPNPCQIYEYEMTMRSPVPGAAPERRARARRRSAKSLGVTIEAEYSVGEYDILILSAKESEGLLIWLNQEGYKLPEKAEPVLRSYIKQDMKFFVAKVDLERHAEKGTTWLSPLQVAYESRKFMLPIRLGTVNAKGTQELFIYALTRTGRIETTNYRTVRLPTGMDIPTYVKEDFGSFYKAMFDHQVKKEGMKAVFLEYAWDMNWCDPCAADPLSNEELKELGVFWLADGSAGRGRSRRRPPPWAGGGAKDVFVTRLHLRYDAEHFPEDLVFHETGDRTNFQGRYVLRHPWKGSPDACDAAKSYFEEVEKRKEEEARTLAKLTGWSLKKIRKRYGLTGKKKKEEEGSWWKKLWGE